jgi:hypothetical protein
MPRFVKAGRVVLMMKHAAGNTHHNANILYNSCKECITSKRCLGYLRHSAVTYRAKMRREIDIAIMRALNAVVKYDQKDNFENC